MTTESLQDGGFSLFQKKCSYSDLLDGDILSFEYEMAVPWIVVAAAEGDQEKCFFDELMNTQPNNYKGRLNDPPEVTDKDDSAIELRSFIGRPLNEEEGVTENDQANEKDDINIEEQTEMPPNGIIPSQSQDIGDVQVILRKKKSAIDRLLPIPPEGPFVNLSPRPLRRAISVRSLNELAPPTSFLRRPASSASIRSPLDSISAINVPIGNNEMTQKHKNMNLKHSLSKLLSSVYAMFLIVIGIVINIGNQQDERQYIPEIFSCFLAMTGLIFLIALHIDLYRYKSVVLRQLKEREDAMQEAAERFSTATEFIINSGFAYATATTESEDNSEKEQKLKIPPYRFLQGRHSGSFYLKIGMAAFCFGYLIYEGLQLGQHILNFIDNEKKMMKCSRTSSVILHIVLPIYAFYQLFITFKYSNIVINRYKALARFGLMHLIATCVSFWFGTIVEEAVEDYNHKNENITSNVTDVAIGNFRIQVQKRSEWNISYQCKADSVLSSRSLTAIPYLYPFAIEYNIILAGVWYVVWQNIGQEHHPSDPHHIRHTISQDETGCEEITYQSNLVINADCHASNKGLFCGLFILLTTIVTVIVFFVAMSTEGYQERAVAIHTGQEGILTFVGLMGSVTAMIQIHKLDMSRHPITFLDDVLMFVPLPFFFLHGIMSIIAEFHFRNYARLVVHALVTIQVIFQTTFIKDGLRRCSNSQSLKYKKPGREIITFLIILNITLWIVNTFELKSVEGFHAQEEYFGDFIWMFIGHTTLPLTLFYRFHSSVCLSDMWKSAYVKES